MRNGSPSGIRVLQMGRRSSTAANVTGPELISVGASHYKILAWAYLPNGMSYPQVVHVSSSQFVPPPMLVYRGRHFCSCEPQLGRFACDACSNDSLLILDIEHKNSDACAVRGPSTRMGHIPMYSARGTAHTSSDVPYTVSLASTLTQRDQVRLAYQ